MERVFGHERLAQQVGEMVAAQVYKGSTSDYRSALFGEAGTTEIEKLFLYALDAYCEYHICEREPILIYKQPGEFAIDAAKEPFSGVCVEQQVDVGDWRVDFVIHEYDWTCEKWRSVIVECDGHDFHERTKEQAARDRSRDRRASLSGTTVLRFTGSEIWNDPLGCAEQVMRWFIAESVREKPLGTPRAASQ
jgi:very-short-patch-repair endonuclease